MMYFAATVFPAPLSPLCKGQSRGDVRWPHQSHPSLGALGWVLEQDQGMTASFGDCGHPPGLPRGVRAWLGEELLLQEMLDFSSPDLEVEGGDLGASEGSPCPCPTS